MEEATNETLDLSKRGLKKIEKALPEESKTIINLILDQNELQRLDNIDTYSRVENLSICNNFLLRMYSVCRLTNLRVLSLNNNGLLQIEGLKDLLFLRILKLAGNNIKSIEHLNNNVHLEELDLSNNQISFIADISYLKNLKMLNLERNRIIDLRQCDRYLPPNLATLGLAYNKIVDLNEISHLVHLTKLDSFTVQGNPCVAIAGKDQFGFDYRPFILNWILSVKSIDGFVVSAIESLKAEWLYSQGKGRSYTSGQHEELCKYLAETCPLTADALETEDQRKLRLILCKAQQHQQQLKEHTNTSPARSKLQSPRMQCRIPNRHMGRSPDRMSSSVHAGLTPRGANSQQTVENKLMSQSFDSPGLMAVIDNKEREPPSKPQNASLEAASKMVPVPESLMSPDYQDPQFDIHRCMSQRNSTTSQASNNSHVTSHPSNNSHVTPHPSNNSHADDKRARSLRDSPKMNKSGSASPRLKPKSEVRRNSVSNSKCDVRHSPKRDMNGKLNGTSEKESREEKKDSEKPDVKKRDRREECTAAVMIQKMWRGYRSRNLNKDTLRILHAIQTARSKQHIERLTNDMEATKAALDSERKIQQLQMQAINALWKKVSCLQNGDSNRPPCVESHSTLRELSATCTSLQGEVSGLRDILTEVLTAVTRNSHSLSAEGATQTDITAVDTPQEERSTWLRRPQSLPLSAPVAPSALRQPELVTQLDTPSVEDPPQLTPLPATSAAESQLVSDTNETNTQEPNPPQQLQDNTRTKETETCNTDSGNETATVTNTHTDAVSNAHSEGIRVDT